MKRSMYRFTRSTTVLVAAALFCLTVILGSPSISPTQTGQAAPPAKAPEAKAPAAAVKAPEAKAPAAKVPETTRFDARINDLHAKLKITAAQEEQWGKVAAVMRENAAAMEPLVKARQEKGATLNAVEDLKSYARITDAHAAGLSKFIPVFETLYTGMSDEQKKIADNLFAKHDLKKRPKKK